MSLLLRVLLLGFLGTASAGADDGSAYYRELNYHRELIDTGDGFRTRYRKLVSEENEIRVSENRILFVKMKLFLLPEDRYLLSYLEYYHVRRNANSEWQLELGWSGNCPKILKGSWTAPERQLLAEHPFTADRYFTGGRPTLKIEFVSPIVSRAVLGAEFPFEWDWSGNPMEHELGFFGCSF